MHLNATVRVALAGRVEAQRGRGLPVAAVVECPARDEGVLVSSSWCRRRGAYTDVCRFRVANERCCEQKINFSLILLKIFMSSPHYINPQ